MNGYFVVTGLLFLLVGLRALLNPIAAVATPYSLTADSVDAKNYLRSGAGGVAIACGGVFLAAVFVPSLAFAALVVAVTLLGGLVSGRLFSLAVDGQPGITPWIAGAAECLGLVMGLYWLWQLLTTGR